MADGNLLSDEEYEYLFDNELEYYRTCLQIRTKQATIVPLELNSSQMKVHNAAERQLREKGRVRLILPKGRQMGISTLIGGRGYRKTSLNTASRAAIVAHDEASTQALLTMVKRFHELNLIDMRPQTGKSNDRELIFPGLDSSYIVSTAGGRSLGRSQTLQFLHVSEYDFWPDDHAEENMTGLLEALGDADGTEAFIESTGKVPGGRMQRAIRAAQRGESEFELLFLKWFEHEEYEREVPEGFEFPDVFLDYQAVHGMSDEALYWGYMKNREMCARLGLRPDVFSPTFKQEYPATVEEAFESTDDDLIKVYPMAWVKAAQARWVRNQDKDLKPQSGVGVDVAQGGSDNTAVALLHETRFQDLKAIPGKLTPDGPAVAGALVPLLRDESHIAVDLTGGWGGDTLTHLKKHLKLPAFGINVSEKPTAKTRDAKLEFRNQRVQIYWQFREALHPENGDGIELPPDDELYEELMAVTFEVTGSGIDIMKKDAMKKLLGRSPDKLEAVLLAYQAGKQYMSRVIGSSAHRAAVSRRVVKQHPKVLGKRR